MKGSGLPILPVVQSGPGHAGGSGEEPVERALAEIIAYRRDLVRAAMMDIGDILAHRMQETERRLLSRQRREFDPAAVRRQASQDPCRFKTHIGVRAAYGLVERHAIPICLWEVIRGIPEM